MAESMPSSSSRTAASSAQSASRKRLQERRPRPWPRWSMATTRKCSLRASKAWNQLSPALASQPWSSSSVGASSLGPGSSRTKVMPRSGSSMRRPRGNGGPAATSSRLLVTPICGSCPDPLRPRYASHRARSGTSAGQGARAGTYLAGRWPAAQSQRAVSARVSVVGRSGWPRTSRARRVVARLPAGQVVHSLARHREVGGDHPHEDVVEAADAPQDPGRHGQAPHLPARHLGQGLVEGIGAERPTAQHEAGRGRLRPEQGHVQVSQVPHVDDGPAARLDDRRARLVVGHDGGGPRSDVAVVGAQHAARIEDRHRRALVLQSAHVELGLGLGLARRRCPDRPPGCRG